MANVRQSGAKSTLFLGPVPEPHEALPSSYSWVLLPCPDPLAWNSLLSHQLSSCFLLILGTWAAITQFHFGMGSKLALYWILVLWSFFQWSTFQDKEAVLPSHAQEAVEWEKVERLLPETQGGNSNLAQSPEVWGCFLFHKYFNYW